jgi:hypothetical protein
MKKLTSRFMVALFAALAMVSGAFAQSGDFTFDTAQITAAQTAVSTGMKSMVSSAVPIVGGIIVAGLVIWGIFWIIDLLKKAGSKAKGR